jgi:hypothetical protein
MTSMVDGEPGAPITNYTNTTVAPTHSAGMAKAGNNAGAGNNVHAFDHGSLSDGDHTIAGVNDRTVTRVKVLYEGSNKERSRSKLTSGEVVPVAESGEILPDEVPVELTVYEERKAHNMLRCSTKAVKELMPLVVSKLDFKSWLLHQQKEHCVPKAGEGLGKLHSEENKMMWQNLHKAQAEGDELTKQPKLGSQVALKMLKEAHNHEPLDQGPATVSAEHSQCDVALSMLARDLAVPTYLEIAKPGVDSTNTVFQDAPGGLLLRKNGWGSHCLQMRMRRIINQTFFTTDRVQSMVLMVMHCLTSDMLADLQRALNFSLAQPSSRAGPQECVGKTLRVTGRRDQSTLSPVPTLLNWIRGRSAWRSGHAWCEFV